MNRVTERNGEEKELSLQECQQAALKVLIQFDQICQEQGFRYYLAYGSLIGAIRHNGFIPWDDDLDVMMPRPDFDRFMVFMNEHAEEYAPLKLHTRANTKNYYFAIPRLSDMTYKYISLNKWEREYDIGAFIDIYPWDNFGNNREDAEKLFKMSWQSKRRYSWYINPRNDEDSPKKALMRKVMHCLLRITKGSRYDQRIDAELRQEILDHTSDNDKFFGHVVWMLGIAQFEKSRLMNLDIIRHPFEGYEFNIPAAYDYMLTVSYGDYMKLPPEDQRTPTHSYKIVRRNTQKQK